MEQVLDTFKRPYNPSRSVMCMDETPRQLIGETKLPISPSLGRCERYNYEYERKGICGVFMVIRPLGAVRFTNATQTKTARDWSEFLEDISNPLAGGGKITLVMDNLNTHTPDSLYETMQPVKAKALWERFEFIYTPKHCSWLNMAEIEINAMITQYLSRRISKIEVLRREVNAWNMLRNQSKRNINWQFTTDDARIKLRRFYPAFQN